MPEPSKIPVAFASSGDKNSIPQSSGTPGLASWSEGFPAITSTPFAQGGLAPKRADFNGIFNALSLVSLWVQQGGIWTYDNLTDYEVGNIVFQSGEIYACLVANGPGSTVKDPATDTTETYWKNILYPRGTFDRMYFSQTSGSYTAPRTGVYRITLKGGGGGGGGSNGGASALSGTGGGEGGTLIFYYNLTKSQSYPYIIGAGGSAGTNGGGGNGGTTSFNSVASADGGGGGAPTGNLTKPGGRGGYYFVVPAGVTALKIPGACGESCGGVGSGTTFPVTYAACGGGNGGGNGATTASMGGGGSGVGVAGGSPPAAQDGAPGYILIEYAG